MFQECKKAGLSLWQCPPFLFMVMGIVTIVAMIATYVLASSRADEPQIAALIVMGVAAFIFVIGNIIINSFNRVSEANRLKSEFIYIISHQLRSPLAIFKWTLDMLEHRLGKIPVYESVENFLYTLRNSSEYMIRLADSLLEINRLESGSFKLKKENFSLSILTKEILRIFPKYAEASNITISFEGTMETPIVFADKERITLAIHNLIDNAIRYTQGAGDIIIRIEPEDSYLVWSIKDEGIGIAREKQKYMFQKFFRSDEAVGVQTYGSGLGLYIAKQIIDLSGGQIGFRSEDGKGSTFWFSLPIKSNK
ncbi:MAG: HAMP domain-containing sensor histidine kinase [bacterium]|nr:HAMP domain-containing sensor histidine kinase [bacterium]